jgi:anti-anti-sigma factor
MLLENYPPSLPDSLYRHRECGWPILIYNCFILITETKTRSVEPDITVFEISGRLILGDLLQSVEGEIRELIDSGVRKLAIDVTGLNLIDSSGIGTLINSRDHMDRLGGQMRLVGAHGAVAKIFGTIRIERVISLDADLASACRYFSGRASGFAI